LCIPADHQRNTCVYFRHFCNNNVTVLPPYEPLPKSLNNALLRASTIRDATDVAQPRPPAFLPSPTSVHGCSCNESEILPRSGEGNLRDLCCLEPAPRASSSPRRPAYSDMVQSTSPLDAHVCVGWSLCCIESFLSLRNASVEIVESAASLGHTQSRTISEFPPRYCAACWPQDQRSSRSMFVICSLRTALS
jgi:hypothetical protein